MKSKFFAEICLLTPVAAFAGGPEQIYGKWEEKHSLGSVINEFTAESIVLSQVDASGKPAGTNQTYAITYQPLGQTNGKDTFGVNFSSADGKPGGGIMVIVIDANHILEDFPGMGAHSLTRIKP